MSFLFEPQFHRFIICGIFILAGILHFIKPKFYLRIMPNYIPYHKMMVYISGAAEILGGVGLLIPATQGFAAWGLILLLFAIFPANFDMACKGYKKRGLTRYTWLLIGRLPLQFLLMFWIYWAALV
ncbi:MAG: DoxX family protein [Balneolaceae bacterium]